MGRIVNEASLSHSGKKSLSACPRRFYLQRYRSWLGWEKNAPADARLAYRLKQQGSWLQMAGQAVEAACVAAMRLARDGEKRDAGAWATSIAASARDRLRQRWEEHGSRGWMTDPKRVACISERYYGDPLPGKERVSSRIESCARTFAERWLPWLVSIPEAEVYQIPELDVLDVGGVRLFAVPDFVRKGPDRVKVIDWKTGRPRPADREQLALYALWADARFNADPEKPRIPVDLALAYLESGREERVESSPALLEQGSEIVNDAATALRARLVDGDLEKNVPLPMESWPMAADQRECYRCSFREACGLGKEAEAA